MLFLPPNRICGKQTTPPPGLGHGEPSGEARDSSETHPNLPSSLASPRGTVPRAPSPRCGEEPGCAWFPCLCSSHLGFHRESPNLSWTFLTLTNHQDWKTSPCVLRVELESPEGCIL